MIAALVLAFATAVSSVYSGTDALQSGPSVVRATLTVTPLPHDRARFDVVQRRDGAIVRGYALDMTQIMHLIVISGDFTTFAHLHPRLLANGHLVVDAAVPRGPYLVYADSTPKHLTQQVARFGIGSRPRASLVPTTNAVAVGPYVVHIATTAFRSRSTTPVAVTITKDGRAAGDLQPYLGAAGHAVFINTRDLTYVHVHPYRADAMTQHTTMPGMDMTSGPALAGPHLLLHAEIREPGTYKLWFQFRGNGRLYVAPFVVTVR